MPLTKEEIAEVRAVALGAFLEVLTLLPDLADQQSLTTRTQLRDAVLTAVERRGGKGSISARTARRAVALERSTPATDFSVRRAQIIEVNSKLDTLITLLFNRMPDKEGVDARS